MKYDFLKVIEHFFTKRKSKKAIYRFLSILFSLISIFYIIRAIHYQNYLEKALIAVTSQESEFISGESFNYSVFKNNIRLYTRLNRDFTYSIKELSKVKVGNIANQFLLDRASEIKILLEQKKYEEAYAAIVLLNKVSLPFFKSKSTYLSSRSNIFIGISTFFIILASIIQIMFSLFVSEQKPFSQKPKRRAATKNTQSTML